MKTHILLACTCCVLLAGRPQAAEEESAPRTNMKEVLRARMAEEARKKSASPPARATPTAPAAAPATVTAAAPAAAEPEKPATPPPATEAAAKETPKPTKEHVTVMPKVEVKKGRITVLDHDLALQEKEIARERKNLKASEVDLALNDAKIAKPLAIFGGESSQFRQRVASERVELMEFEKDLIEAIAQAKTKDEKQELQKQLDQIRAVRRDLDKSLR